MHCITPLQKKLQLKTNNKLYTTFKTSRIVYGLDVIIILFKAIK